MATKAARSRREFLGRLGGVTAAAVVANSVGVPSPLFRTPVVEAAEVGPLRTRQRRNAALRVRHEAALNEAHLPLPEHPTNNDDEARPTIASFGKSLPHDDLGEIDAGAYGALLNAMTTGEPADFEVIPLGGPGKLVNPQAALAFDLDCADSHHLGIAAAPGFRSAWRAGEAKEVYWQALTRDVPFENYAIDPLTLAAANDLSASPDFRGPKIGGLVTPATLFRANTPGDLNGPYISQFLWKTVPYGTTPIVQLQNTTVVGNDHMTTYGDWLNVQRGLAGTGSVLIDGNRRYIRSGRDLAEWLRLDFTYQGVLNACQILLAMGAPRDAGNPYVSSATQAGFATFGPPHILDLVAHSANGALRAVWYQKWSVHRTLRPEAFGGRIHNHKIGASSYPIHRDILDSPVLTEVFNRFGSYLLPQAYPSGSPVHPSYPAGHAGLAGAGVTVLKAFFNESFVIPQPVVASPDGLTLLAYSGPPLTVGGELNKLAANIALGRDTAGIHWRSDGIDGLLLGEQVAISILRGHRGLWNEAFEGFSLTKFDGTTITI